MKKQRAEFLGDVSHQLRTPLTAIKGSTSTLLNSTYPLNLTETRQFLRVIDEQSEHMHRLITDLVDVTQIEAGILTVNPEPTVLADILDEAREAYLLDGESNNNVDVDLSPTLPRVMADRRRVPSGSCQPPLRGIRILSPVIHRQDQRISPGLAHCNHSGRRKRRRNCPKATGRFCISYGNRS